MSQSVRILPLLTRTSALVWCLLAGVAYAQEAAPVVPAPVPASAEANNGHSIEDALLLDEDQKQTANRIRSIFFTREEMQDIRLAINTYRKHFRSKTDAEFDEEDFLNQLTGMRKSQNGTERFYVYPQFFLDSLVYHSPGSWVVWVQDTTHKLKITQDTLPTDMELQVLEIDKDKVKFLWRPLEMDRVIQSWEQTGKNEAIIDKVNASVVFTLRPNQTFSSFAMRPLEGRVLPVTLDNNAVGEQLAKDAQVKAKAEETDPSVTTREGIGGLINAYEHIGTEKSQADAVPPVPTASPAPTTPVTPEVKP